jgi:hypothetical protein
VKSYLTFEHNFKRWGELRTAWIDAQKKLSPVLQAHLSSGSLKAVTETHKLEFQEAKGKNDVLAFWKLIIQTHTYKGLKVSTYEKREALQTLQRFRQKSLSLAEYNDKFDKLVESCENLGVEIDPTELIPDYLVGIDDSDLTPKTREFIIMGEDDEKFPESLEEAKRKMKETKSHELDLKKRKRTRAEASNHMVTNVSSDSNNSSSSEGHSSQPEEEI